MSDDCNVCDFPAEFCGCPFDPQCTVCGLPMEDGPDAHNCLAITPSRFWGSL
jgi:hypothetical protein